MIKLNGSSSSTLYRDKIDYVLTACLYCWLIWISSIRSKIQMSVFYVLRVFVVIFLPKPYLNRFYRRHIGSMKAQNIIFGNMEYGDDIMTAKNIVFNTCCGYLALPVTVTACFIFSLIGWRNIIRLFPEGTGWVVIPLTLYAIVAVCAYKLRKTSCDPRSYLSYFKKFKKNDNEWLKKWKCYCFFIFIGSFLSIVLSIGVILLSITIDRNLYGPI